ncbi:PTS system, diacetylchitobiose-specific IIC component (plasmid) [Borrelia crocidurae DOU]|uniref:Permease IIC component n=2 Tax=Borrelia crocidurae TaxID=29520 RepID=W5SKU4_9SPIR|nr:PTS system, diacetylchitobiose-specific IIC component [Borrelia crocidurae DOU]
MGDFMKFQNFIDTGLVPIAGKIASNKYLIAVRDGFAFSMPFLIVGSFILLLANLPFTDANNFLYQQWYVDLMAKYKENLMQPFYVSMGVMAIFVVFGIGYNLSHFYKMSGITGGFISLFTFLILGGQSGWVSYGGEIPKWIIISEGLFPVIDARYLGAQGVFTGIVVAIFSVEIYRFFINKKMIIRLPESVPPAVIKSFEALIPVFLLAIISQTMNIFVQSTTGKLLPEIIMNIFSPILYVSDTLFGVVVIVFLIHILWFCGLHGGGIVGALLGPITLANLEINARALSENNPLPSILAGGFLNTFVHIGGSGATLGLAIAMIISKTQYLKTIGKFSFISSIFNINEPIIFGVPIVLNPVLGIPFIIIPLINTVIAYSLTYLGIIEKVRVLIPWTTPSILASFISTGLDFKALILSVILIILAMLMYLPFLKVYEKILLRQEKA